MSFRSNESQQMSIFDSTYNLTEREKMILLRVKKGQTSKIIANELNLSVNTIKTHRLSICKKLAVNSMAEAIVVAEKHGYI